jgi:TPR repeat protein
LRSIVTLWCRCGSGQSSLQLGLAYYKGKPAGIARDYEKAFKFFSLAAEGGGSCDALYYMGIMLLRGQGAKGDCARAVECFQRAAAAGHVLAQYQLATLCCCPQTCAQHQPAFSFVKL